MLALFGAARSARADGENRNQHGNEIAVVPVVGGSSDIGIGVGALGAIAHFQSNRDVFQWRLEGGALLTYKANGGASHLPYQDFYLKLTVLDLGPGVRLDLRPSYTREATQGYYGLGNDSQRVDALNHTTFYQYGRTHPTMEALFRITLSQRFFLVVGNYFTFDQIRVYDGSKLQADIHSPNPVVRNIIGTPKTHAVDFLEAALHYDTRDDETIPYAGQFHSLQFRYSPGGTTWFPYSYGQLNFTTRFYASPFGPRFTLAARLVTDLQFGNPPFYELARYDDTFALGGVNGVRGVPGQRYYGKIKIFGNLEERFRLFQFKLFSRHLHFGIATFLDGGRLWTDYSSNPELDGTTLGLKWGAGGGLRLQQGTTFVVRADVAYSPDATPIAGYLGVGEIF